MITKQRINDFFIEDTITKLAQEETGKRQYYRPVYSLHKWWARRPGALFRAMILLSAFPDSVEQLFGHNESNIDPLKSMFFKDQHLKDMVILDPFMGGGTTLVEGNRMGAKVIGCDLNPVSYWIVRETLKQIDLKKLESYFVELEGKAGENIKPLYKTQCPQCENKNADILYAFWVRYIECPQCSQPVYLFKRYFLNEGISRTQEISRTNPAVVICPSCHSLNHFKGEGNCMCDKCGFIFHPSDQVFDNGYFYCPHCSSKKLSLIESIQRGHSLKEKPFAIEYYCHECRERLYKSPDEYDTAFIIKVDNDFKIQKEKLIFPKQEIPSGSTAARWIAHDFRYYYQVFNARQIISFNHLFTAIAQIPDEEYRNAFVTIFSNSLEYNNMMTPYNYPHRKLHHLFNYHALPLTTTPVENNVWGVLGMGAGTFVNCYRRYVEAKQYCQRPFDKFKQNNEIKTFRSKEKIQAQFVPRFEDLKAADHGVLLHCGDSAHLSFIPDESVDAVITDPPYFDNIHYSELSNFFYVWLRLFQPSQYFASDHVSTEQEAIVNVGMNKTDEDYQRLITSVFSECARVLKDSGSMMFTFHHSKPRAWWVILQAIVNSGFIVVDYFPVTSEYKVNPHVRDKAAIDKDLVIICEKQKLHQSDDFKLSFDLVSDRASKRIASLYDHQSGSENFCFYYIGEMLLIGSQSVNIRLDVFENIFSQAEKFKDKIKSSYHNEANDIKLSEYADLPLFAGLIRK